MPDHICMICAIHRIETYLKMEMYLFNAANECPLRWRHSERDGVSNHQPQDCLLNRLFRRRSGKTSKLCVTGICAGNSPVISEVPAQKAINAENVSIWWRHHGLPEFWYNWVRVMIFYVIFESESAPLTFPTVFRQNAQCMSCVRVCCYRFSYVSYVILRMFPRYFNIFH